MIAVTGSTGFIGQHVIATLLASGYIGRIRCLLLPGEEPVEGTESITGNLVTGEGLEHFLEDAETVIHLAAKNIDTDGSGFEAINVGGTSRLCQEANEADVRRMIMLSSVGVYGHYQHINADENTPVQPDTHFSRSKASAEFIALEAKQQGWFETVILRHRFVYGLGDNYVMPRLIKAAKKMPFLVSRGRAEMSFILAEELADIIRRFIEVKLTGAGMPVYHVTDGVPVSLKTIIGTICKAYDLKTPSKSIPYGLLYRPVRFFEKIRGIDPEVSKSPLSSIRLKFAGLTQSFSNAKLSSLFPDLNLTPFREGFPPLAEYYRQYLE